jgi:hypothetical protein
MGSIEVKALGYKPEGRGFETQWDEAEKNNEIGGNYLEFLFNFN